MERHVACDPHAASCTFSVRSANGKVLHRDVVETDGEPLVSCMRGLGGRIHLCAEEGEWSQCLAELLEPYVAELVVVEPERKRGSKSERLDADGLSEQIRSGRLDTVVFKDQGRFRAHRELGRAHRMVRSNVAHTKNRIKTLARRGEACGRQAKHSSTEEGRHELTDQVPAVTRWAIELLDRELAFLPADGRGIGGPNEAMAHEARMEVWFSRTR